MRHLVSFVPTKEPQSGTKKAEPLAFEGARNVEQKLSLNPRRTKAAAPEAPSRLQRDQSQLNCRRLRLQ